MKIRLLSCVLGTLALLAGLTAQAQDASIRAGHLAPFAENITDTSVTLAISDLADQVVLQRNNVTYGTFTDFINVPAGTYTVRVIPTGQTDPVLEQEVTLAENITYTAVVIGNDVTEPFDENQPLEVLLLEDDTSALGDNAIRLRAAHVAPVAPDINNTAVDIRAEGDEGQVVLVDDLLYKGTPLLEGIDPGTVNLVVTNPDGSTVLVDPEPFDVEAGYNATLFVIGDGENQPLRVFALPIDPAATPSGILPETPVETDACFTGSWFNPATDGQGLNFEVIPSQSRLVGYWYTFSQDGGERVWYTLDGSFMGDGTTATTTVFSTTGGAFNNPDVAANPAQAVGTLDVTFTSPTTATAEFDVTDDDLVDEGGTLELQRLTPLVEDCTIFASDDASSESASE